MGLFDSMKSRLGLEGQRQWDDDDYADDGYTDDYDASYDDARDSDDDTPPDHDDGYYRDEERGRSAYTGTRNDGVKVIPRDMRVSSRTSSAPYRSTSSYVTHRDDDTAADSDASTRYPAYQAATGRQTSSRPQYNWRGSTDDSPAAADPPASEPEFMRNRPQRSSQHHQTVASRYDSASSTSNDPYDDFLRAPRAVPAKASMKIITPSSYADAEGVAAAFKIGLDVALSLSSVRPELAKRILDFSFGVVSALGGTVEKVAEKVFLLSHSSTGITEDETRQLREAGVIR